VDDAWKEAVEIANGQEGWKQEKKNDHGDVVVSKKSRKGKKIYRVTAKIDIEPAKLIEYMADTEKITKWNTTLTEHKVLKVCCTF